MKKNRFVGRCATFFLAAGLFSTIVFSCKEDAEDKVKPKTITDIILQNDEFSILKEIMLNVQMSDSFRTENLTVLAPDNDAFAKAKISGSAAIIAKGEPFVRLFLKHHIIGKEVISYDKFSAGTKKSLNGDTLKIEKKDSIVTINGSEIKIRNVNADNGIIQVIDSLLIK